MVIEYPRTEINSRSLHLQYKFLQACLKLMQCFHELALKL